MFEVIVAVLAIFISIASLFVVWRVLVGNQNIIDALQAAEAENKELTSTLVEIVDDGGEMRGQLMLPGQVPTGEAVKQLEAAQKEMKSLLKETEKMRDDLDKTRKRESKQAQVLAEVVDAKGEVLTQLRLSGEKVTPNKTPCGDLCIHASWSKNHKCWICEANQGKNCDHSRPQFLDALNQCVMFKRRS